MARSTGVRPVAGRSGDVPPSRRWGCASARRGSRGVKGVKTNNQQDYPLRSEPASLAAAYGCIEVGTDPYACPKTPLCAGDKFADAQVARSAALARSESWRAAPAEMPMAAPMAGQLWPSARNRVASACRAAAPAR